MSHKEEQIQEVEALESIFGEEIESWYFIFGYIFGYFVLIIFFSIVIETEPFHILQFDVNTEHYKSDPENEGF